jgi:tetratricopeptide (TPR) repeat protein
LQKYSLKYQNDRDVHRELARSLSYRGDVRLQLGQPNRARDSYKEAAKLLQQLADNGEASEDRLQLARSFSNMGKYFQWQSDLDQSIKNYTEALHIYETVTSAEPDFPLYRSELGDTCLWLAELHLDRNEPGKAKGLIEKARTTFDEISARGADGASVRGGRVRCTALEARAHALADPARGAEEAAKAVTQLEELTKFLNTEQRKRTADDLYVWAVVRALRGDKEATLRSLEEAINAYGFRNFARMHRDVAFQPLLTNDPQFKKAVGDLESCAKCKDQQEEE